jgi:hypothetical protein
MVPDSLRDRWGGSAWRWWALVAGALLALATVAVGRLLAALIGGGRWDLVLLALLVELFALGVAGSGMLDGLAGRAIAGGMSRQPLLERRRGNPTRTLADQERLDRRTIRSALIAVPVGVAFVVVLVGLS